MNDEDLLRYSRHLLLDEFDIEGQQALIDAKVLVVGAGGLGCPAAMYLASSGVGSITLIDDDHVEMSNLQRQIGHTSKSLGVKKVDSLKQTLLALNPTITVNSIDARLNSDLVDDIISQVDLVLDCSDNFTTRFLVNRACRRASKKLVVGAAQAAEGQALLLSAEQGAPCYECLFKETEALPDINCASSGVLAPIVGIVGSYQALMAIKALTGYGESQASLLMAFDFYTGLWRQFKVKQDPECPCCSQ